MPIDGLVFTRISDELRNTLKQARIQGVFQPTSTEILLHLRQPGRTHRLLVSIDPSLARVHLTDEEPENPLSPPPFCLLLRKHLVPGRIVDVWQPPYERLLKLVVEGRDESGQPTERSLYIEIMGRHSNVILTRADGVILDALRRVPQEVNRHREILPNREYTPPPSQERVDPDSLTEDGLSRVLRLVPAGQSTAKTLAENVAGFSPLAGREVVVRAGLPVGITRDELTPSDLSALWTSFSEVIEAVRARPSTPTAVSTSIGLEFWLMPLVSVQGEERSFSSVQEMLDWVYVRRAAEQALLRERQALVRTVDQHLRRVERRIAAQEEELREAGFADEYRIFGDVLMANLHRIEPRAGRVTLPNFYDGDQPLAISLDPALSPAANAQGYYRRYQKAKKRLAVARERLEASQEEQRYLESVRTALELCDGLSELAEIRLELVQAEVLSSPKPGRAKGREGARKRRDSSGSSPLSLVSSDGFPILVGRNNRQNDLLTMEIARDDDLWFHAKEIPGAHVVVQSRGGDIPETTLMEAAAVAAFFSKARESANVPVDFTRKKHVRKPRGARPGMVIYDHQRTVYVTPGRDQLTRLGLLERLEASESR